mgnify:CR=1 FL=1
MVFCNLTHLLKQTRQTSHNPYFNRWFSAIRTTKEDKKAYDVVTILILIDGFLQSKNQKKQLHQQKSHNPYFNRWFSAIIAYKLMQDKDEDVTILILIDGFLQ